MSNFLTAARHTDKASPLPHQDAAWTYAWDCLTQAERDEFLSIFRAATPTKDDDVANNWAGIAGAAAQAGCRYPELLAAQWALESGWGKHPSGRFNYWGIKGAGTAKPTMEVVNGREVAEVAEFKDFRTIREGVTWLVDRWYKDFTDAKGVAHRGVNNADDREDAASMLVSEGYATDPAYAAKLCRLMAENAPRPRPTQSVVMAEANVWRTKIQALNLSQPDASTCQAACIGMAVADRDIPGIRSRLRALGTAGSPAVMAAVIRSYPKVRYQYEGNASLELAIEWLKRGELLITHGWFSGSGHVIVLDGLQKRPDGSMWFDVKDPYGEFDAASWGFKGSAKFFDGFYSESLIYSACVAGGSAGQARQLYGKPVDRKRGGMWVHRFLA